MSIENKIRSNLAALDGTPKDFASVEHLFDDVYHPEFVFEENGKIVSREEIKQIRAKGFKLGSKATPLLLRSTSPDTIESKFRLTNSHWDVVVHVVGEIKDGKVYRARPVDGSKHLLVRNLKTYISAFDGTPKDFSEVGQMFEQIYHDDFVYKEDGKSADKQQIKQWQKDFFAIGSKATLLLLKEVGPDTVEFKIRMTNSTVDVIHHNIAMVKDNKLIASKPVDQASIVTNIETYIAAFDGTPRDFSEVSQMFELIYHDDFVYHADGNPVDKQQMIQFQKDFFALGSKATLLLCKEVGPDTVEFKIRLTNSKFDVIMHSIAMVRDNKLIASEPVDQDSISSVAHIREVCQAYETEMASRSIGKLPLVEDDNGNDNNGITAPQ